MVDDPFSDAHTNTHILNTNFSDIGPRRREMYLLYKWVRPMAAPQKNRGRQAANAMLHFLGKQTGRQLVHSLLFLQEYQYMNSTEMLELQLDEKMGGWKQMAEKNSLFLFCLCFFR